MGGDNRGGEQDGLQALTSEMCTKSQVNLYYIFYPWNAERH